MIHLLDQRVYAFALMSVRPEQPLGQPLAILRIGGAVGHQQIRQAVGLLGHVSVPADRLADCRRTTDWL